MGTLLRAAMHSTDQLDDVRRRARAIELSREPIRSTLVRFALSVGAETADEAEDLVAELALRVLTGTYRLGSRWNPMVGPLCK